MHVPDLKCVQPTQSDETTKALQFHEPTINAFIPQIIVISPLWINYQNEGCQLLPNARDNEKAITLLNASR